MEKLIIKGGFRERANRYKKYQQSENQQTKLENHTYRKSTEKNVTPDNQVCNEKTE
ncbi:hypothetical protein [Acinetobacter sp. MD2(2019)]|uniref:hypothetical protein n=1 Tax=Acinetobacter sp. MD2(2019) TaxID=2605273 RepID=UPI002D1F2F5D|nr:hypothetical protein [Acinetobacter sp. MD2(2019)]MEB3754881.1 hypothetical protein [Acinetobacter sp. MD2(2019)]